jgi:hypothetical protein
VQPGEQDAALPLFRLFGHSKDSRRVEADFKVFATGRSIDAAGNPRRFVRIHCDQLRVTSCEMTKPPLHSPESLPRVLIWHVLIHSASGGCAGRVENGHFTWPLPFRKQPTIDGRA